MGKNAVNQKMWFLIGVVVVLLAVLGLGIFAISQSSKNTKESLLELGQRYLDELDYEQAVVCFEEYLEIEPQCVEAYLGLAEAYKGMEDYTKALEILAMGYAVTGDGSLQEMSSQFEEQYAEWLAPENAVEVEVVADEEILYEEEHDSRFEACVVDGIYHHGYEYYDLTSEEEEYLQAIIDQARQGNIDEVYSLLEGDELVALLRNHEAYTEADDGGWGGIYIAFHQFKIFYAGGDDSDLYYFSIIPLEAGEGYVFGKRPGASVLTPREFREWTISDCKNGMFNGQFLHVSELKILDENRSNIDYYTGNVINGLLDGAVIRKGSDGMYGRSDYVLGQINIFKEEVGSDGKTVSYYEYSVDENGEPILYDGNYTGGAGKFQTKEESDVERWTVDMKHSSGSERDGGMLYYSW